MALATPFVVLIPARLGSTRLPRKALADIGGAPMVVRVAQRAAQSQAQRVVVATDDDTIVQACQRDGVEALLTDPHHTSGSDRLAQAADLLQLANDTVVVNVQGDEPLIEPGLINHVAARLAEQPDCAMATAAQPLQAEHANLPSVVKVVLDAQQRALYFSRHALPFAAAEPTATRWHHVGIYAYQAAFLRTFSGLAAAPIEQAEQLEQLRALWHGYRVAVHCSAQPGHPGVDTEADLQRVRLAWPAPLG
ncbi:MAG: 3-deoxy-manno-octulosonate cytidylyltransferase [Burkholderiaceae bacterium]